MVETGRQESTSSTINIGIKSSSLNSIIYISSSGGRVHEIGGVGVGCPRPAPHIISDPWAPDRCMLHPRHTRHLPPHARTMHHPTAPRHGPGHQRNPPSQPRYTAADIEVLPPVQQRSRYFNLLSLCTVSLAAAPSSLP